MGLIVCRPVAEKGEEGRRQFVRAARSRRLGNQAQQSALTPAFPGFIERVTAQRESAYHRRDRLAFEANAPEHLAFNQKKIAWIEEVVVAKEGIGNGFMADMEGPVTAEKARLGKGCHAKSSLGEKCRCRGDFAVLSNLATAIPDGKPLKPREEANRDRRKCLAEKKAAAKSPRQKGKISPTG